MTHGLINCGRRVANIIFAIVWFRIPVSLFNGIGITLALFGAFCYMQVWGGFMPGGSYVRSSSAKVPM